MGKGILMERNGSKAVVLTPQGEFKQVSLPRGPVDIGDEIEYADVRPAAPWARWGLTAAAAAILALAPVGYQSWALAQPVAMVTIDINPSVQLLINKRDEVLSVQALNADGELVLQGVEWKRQQVEDVVASVTANAVELGKLDPGSEAGAVVVAVAPVNDEELPDEVADRIVSESKTSVDATMDAKAKEKGVDRKASSAVLEGTAEERKKAEEKGLSLGKDMILDDIQTIVPDVNPEEYLGKGPGALLKDLGIKPSEIFGKSEEKHNGKGAKPEDKGAKGEDKSNGNGKGNGSSGKAEDKPALGTGTGNNSKDDKKSDDNKKPEVQPSDVEKDDNGKSGSDKKDEPKQGSINDNIKEKQDLLPRAILPGVGASAGLNVGKGAKPEKAEKPEKTDKTEQPEKGKKD